MTRYYAVVMDRGNALFASFDTADKAEAYDMERTAEGYESRTVGEVDGDAYLVIYTRSKKAVKRAKGYIRTPEGEIIPQKATGTAQADPHRCRDCPECAVLFNIEGVHGHVPDRNSRTCQSCERNRGAGQ